MNTNPLRVATFDCYGTLVDWEGGAATFLYDLALRQGEPTLQPGRLLRSRWEALQFELIQGRYRPYKEVLAESLRAWMAERGYPWNPAEGEALVRSMRSWQPFPDTRPALIQAKAQGLRLVIVSNTDRDIIEHTLRQLEVPFDDVITAEDCGAYKPALTVFEQALARVGEPPERALHVAFGFKYDIGPAQQLGCRTAWVNRHSEAPPGSAQPDYVWRDLWGLAELVDGAGPRRRRGSIDPAPPGSTASGSLVHPDRVPGDAVGSLVAGSPEGASEPNVFFPASLPYTDQHNVATS